MRIAALFLVLLSVPFALGAPKPADITVAELSAKRTPDGLLDLDVRVTNSTNHPIHGGRIIFRFFDSRHEPVTTQRTNLDDTTFEPGAESEVHAQMEDHPRAVSLEVGAFDGPGRELRVAKPGPYVIE